MRYDPLDESKGHRMLGCCFVLLVLGAIVGGCIY